MKLRELRRRLDKDAVRRAKKAKFKDKRLHAGSRIERRRWDLLDLVRP